MQNFFDQFDSTPAPTAPPATPGIIRGQPKPVDPFKIAAEQRAQADQARQDAQFQTSQQKAALDIQKTQRDLAPGADTTEAEKTAGFLATRVAGGLRELSRITKAKPEAAKPSFGIEATRSIFGDTAANYLTDADRQQVVAAQTDILDAALTLGTGAAYTAEQLTGYRQSYFPQLGDDDATVKAKQARLLQLLESAKVKAGRAAPQIEQALAAVQADIAGDPTGDPAEAALRQKYPEAAEFLYDKNGELLGFYNKDDEFTLLFGPGGNPQSPPDGGGDLGQAFYAGVGDVAEGVGDVLGLVGNPLNAGINALTGTNLSTDLGQTFRDATGAPDGDPMASAINRGGTAALTMAGAAGAARPFVQGAARTVTNALAAQPAQQLVGGATAGAAAEGAKQAGLPLPAQIGAGLLVGVLGFGGVNALMSAGRPTTVSPVAQAAQRQAVEMLPADIGGATTRRLTAAAAQAPLSAAPITAAAERSSASFGQATQRATQGSRLAPDDAGAIVVRAGERFNKQSRATGGRLYDRAEKLAQGVSIKAKGAIATIDEQIAELSQAREVNAPLINALERFKADLSNNQGIKVSGMRDLRTAAQKAAYTEDMRSTPAQRVLGIVANAISDDINAGLAQAGRANAAQAFKTADSYWRDRVEYIDKVLEPVIGKGKSGEAVLTAVEQMAQGKGKGVQNLMKLMRSVDKEELADIQATVIDRMGKSTAGAQNAEGSAYSASTFLTNWNKMSGKGKAALFPNTEVRRNLDELAMIADNMKQAGKYANSSNTAGGIMGQVAITGGLGMASPTALILGSATQYLSGRALTSPRLTAWLAKVPANPQAQAAHIKRLDAIAAAEPIIANDIASIKQFLANAPSSSRAAATEGEQVGEERPIQP